MTSPQEKKFRLLRAYMARHPVWCTWQVTYRCNFRCRFCHYWRDPMGAQPETTLEQFEEGSRSLARWGSLLISLAGGEPLLREDLTEVVRAVGRWHFPFITTNGYLANESLASELFEAGLWGVSVSIDYADAEKHNAARGVKDAFERAEQALEVFSQARRYDWQRVNLMAVLLDDNLEQVEGLLRLAARHDAYFMIQNYSALKTGSTKFRHAQGGVSAALLDLKRRYSNFLSNPLFLSRFDQALNGGVPHCAAGRAFFNIDSTGDIAICVENRSHPIANLFQDDIHDISKRLRAAGGRNTCQCCWYNCRGEVESLYNLYGLVKSLPTWIFDRGRPMKRQSMSASRERRCALQSI